MAAFTRRSAGSPLIGPYADEVNAWNAAALAHRSRLGQQTPGDGRPAPWQIVFVENTTAAIVPEGRALAISTPLLLSTDLGWPIDPIGVVGVAPAPETNPSHRSRIVITAEPIAAAAGTIGRAYIGGRIDLTVDVINTAHTRARVLPDGTFQSGYAGPVRLLAVSGASTTARTHAILDGFDGGHLWLRVPDAGIDAGTFAVPSTTSCVLAWPDPSTGAITDVPVGRTYREVNVTHYGPAIEPATDKYIQARTIAGRIVPDVEYC